MPTRMAVLLEGWSSVRVPRGTSIDRGADINIYVGNLPYSYDSGSLESLFSQYGAVQSAAVITDRDTGRSRGFGFVEMADEDGRKAIEELNGRDIDGRALTVNEARPRDDRGGGRRGGRY
ncbi:MAG TPA: RNA-binding protein [Acidimicrobiia bacterium]|jgi:cold-inducible RNA-binding protein|nr:RNA-binding protein [Acidimicrobiia bacterium]